jgi:glycosyltransferase involved in cell wall biosynthesis
MTSPLFTVLLPVIRPPALLPYAIETVLAQSERDFELCIIGDGAPEETIACARSYADRDARVKVFAFPKGERHGEAHRHTVLGQASSRYVAYIGDDDLWFPNHLAELTELLAEVDFGNLPQINVWADQTYSPQFGDLSIPATRQKLLTGHGVFFGPTFAGYRLESYRRLPVGWSPAPKQLATDLYMWRKFLCRADMTFATRFVVTGLHMAAALHSEMSLEQRATENRLWFERIQDPAARDEITREVLCTAFRYAAEFKDDEKTILRMRRSFYWRVTLMLRNARRLVRERLRS